MDKKSLLSFIANAHRNTYAAPDNIRKKHKCDEPILSGHEDYQFSDGEFRYHDSFAGSIWAPGREVVFYKNSPVWSMSYQGKSEENLDFLENSVFPFLKKALINFNNELPFRGPRKYTDGDFEYTFEMQGDYSYFTAIEAIKYKGKVVFVQNVMGSLIK